MGGVVLMLMGGLMMRNAQAAAQTISESNVESGMLSSPEVAGFVTSVRNPYFFLWWATIGLQQITFSMTYGWLGLVICFIGHILSDFAWFGLVGWTSAKGRKVCSERTMRGILFAFGVALICLGGLFLFQFVLAV